MDELAQRTGRHYGLVEYSGDPQAERVIVIMGSCGETARETVAHLNASGERVGVAAGAAVPAVPGSRTGGGAAPVGRAGRGARPHQGARLVRRAAVPRRAGGAVRGSRRWPPRADAGGLSAAATACPRRSSRREWSRACWPNWAASVRAPGSRSGSTTTSRTPASTTTRRSTSSRRPRRVRCSSGSAPTGRSAPTRTRSRSSAHNRAARPGLLRLRLQEVGLADRLAPAVRTPSRSALRT